MKAGRLSTSLSDSGERLLDTSELTRLFPVKSDDDGCATMRQPSRAMMRKQPNCANRLVAMQQQIDALEADKTDLRAERDRLLSVIETQAQQVKLLTDQRPAQAEARRGFWRRYSESNRRRRISSRRRAKSYPLLNGPGRGVGLGRRPHNRAIVPAGRPVPKWPMTRMSPEDGWALPPGNDWGTLVAGCLRSGYRHEFFAGLLACLPRQVTHSVRLQLRSRAVDAERSGRTAASDTQDVD